jgi:uncharacterized membrane protein YgcG
VQCKAYQRAQCPADLTPSSLRNGVTVASLPAGGLLQLTAKGTAPGTPQNLDFASAIGPPSGAPDPYGLNNAAALSRTVVKSAVQCTVALSPGALSVTAAGLSTDVAVEAPAGCAWTVRSDQAWTSVAPGSGSGRGSFKLAATANAAATDRQAIVAAQAGAGASVELPVRQLGMPPPAPVVCATLRLSREGEQLGSNRVTNFVEVQSPVDDCTWDVASDTPWIAVLAATRKGSGQVDYEVQPNESFDERRGAVKIGAKVLDVIQAPAGSVQRDDSGGGGDSGGDGSGSGSGGDAGG